jgi:hypothetical protein
LTLTPIGARWKEAEDQKSAGVAPSVSIGWVVVLLQCQVSPAVDRPVGLSVIPSPRTVESVDGGRHGALRQGSRWARSIRDEPAGWSQPVLMSSDAAEVLHGTGTRPGSVKRNLEP